MLEWVIQLPNKTNFQAKTFFLMEKTLSWGAFQFSWLKISELLNFEVWHNMNILRGFHTKLQPQKYYIILTDTARC